MSEAKTGEKNPNFGKLLSTETKNNMSKAHKGKLLDIPKTEIHKERISKASFALRRMHRRGEAKFINKLCIAPPGRSFLRFAKDAPPGRSF